MYRKTYAVVDLNCIANNISELRRCAGTEVMAVVKADAYGHGVEKVSKRAAKEGVKYFAVATPEEALELREYVDGCILILSPVLPEAYTALLGAEVSLCVFTPEHVRAIRSAAEKAGKTAKLHIKLDTGMGRVGLRTMSELDSLLDEIGKSDNLEVEGVFTHFATADETDKEYSKLQAARFTAFADRIESRGYHPLRHAANSAAIIELPDMHFDLCRMGISLYGYPPSGEVDGSGINLRPALSLNSYISYVKTIEPGESVSYGRVFKAERQTRVATVPIGYADGYKRALTSKGAYGLINGEKAPLIGRVCMDQIMFDVTDITAAEGDKVILLGDGGMDAEDMAGLTGTISYEILTSLTGRVPRVYINE